MKKLFISILVLLPALTMQAQNVLTPQQQLEKVQKELEVVKKALEAEKIQAEAAKTKAEADKIKAEAEKMKAEAEKLKAEAEKKVKAKTNKTNAQQTQSASGWAIPTAEPKKTEVKKVEKNANGAVLKTDAKYMEGAITTNAEGKVEFTLDTDANGKSADEIYNIVYQYMSDLTQGENNIKSRMALVNKDQHIIANTMDEWLVFSNTFLSLDRSEFRYNLVASIKDNHLTLSMERLYYVYEEDRSTGFKAPAEEIINDKIALNKKKTDLAKIFGKFRKLTIDRKDQIFSEISTLVKN